MEPEIGSARSELNTTRKFGTEKKKRDWEVFMARERCAKLFSQLSLRGDERSDLASEVQLRGRTGFRRREAEMVLCLENGGRPTYKVEKGKGGPSYFSEGVFRISNFYN